MKATYDPEIAKRYGINAAILLDYLKTLKSTRDDGYCPRTAAEIEDDLGMTARQQVTATKTLIDAGLIKAKTTYVTTLQRSKHFLIIGG